LLRYLLDTHALLYWLFDDRRLSPRARAIISDRGNQILVSSASGWEIGTKYRIGKLPAARTLVQDLSGHVARAGFHELAITMAHAQRAGALAGDHRDPFDRMLAAQGLVEDCRIVTTDAAIAAFGAQTFW
jgi:PIN domain nuclease of toxin-antitoxin system